MISRRPRHLLGRRHRDRSSPAASAGGSAAPTDSTMAPVPRLVGCDRRLELGLGLTVRARFAQPGREVHLFFDLGRVERQRLVLGRLGLDVAVHRHARPGRDELADDHVLLEALEPVGTTLDRRLGEHAGGLLERRRRQPRVGRERRLRDSHELGTTLGRDACPPRRAGGSPPRSGGRRPSRRAGTRCRPAPRRSPGATSGGRSPRCACRGSTRPGRGTPAAPRRPGTAASRARP